MTNTPTEARLADIVAEYGAMADGLPPQLEDGPGAASAFYMSCSLGEVASMARELLSRRSLDDGVEPVVQCATEGCVNAGTERLEAGGVGSDYCQPCFDQIKTLTSPAQETVTDAWRTMDSAPKDGSMILLYNIHHREQAVMGWSVGFDDENFPDGCWTNAGGKNQAISNIANGGYFQFWQPLPSTAALSSKGA